MTAESRKYKGLTFQTGAPFIDDKDKKESIIVRFFLELANSDELCFCDIQFPQEEVINKHHMSEDEVDIAFGFYYEYEKDVWAEARRYAK